MFQSLLWLGTAGLIVTSFSPSGILLRRKLQEGQKDVYRVEMRAQQNATFEGGVAAGVPYDLSIDAGTSVKVSVIMGKLSDDKKVADLEMEFADFQGTLEVMGQVQELPAEVMNMNQKITGRLDERNRLSVTGLPGLPPQLAGFVSSFGMNSNLSSFLFVEFPEKEINIGDTWDVKIPATPFTGNKEVILKARLVGEREEANKPVYEISIEGIIPVNLDLKQFASAFPMFQAQGMDLKMLMTGTIKMEVNALVEKESGRTLFLKNTTTNDQAIEFPDAGFKMLAKGTVLTVTRLLQDGS